MKGNIHDFTNWKPSTGSQDRLKKTLKTWAIVLFANLLSASGVLADALVVTQAMKASTIAEVFVEDDWIRVEIEVGVADVEAFRNLLPDQLYLQVTGESRPLKERLKTFLRDDWKITVEAEPLVGAIESIQVARRIVRDEITGQPLPNQPADAENVIRTVLRYALQNQPKSISIVPPAGPNNLSSANIGFVAYHRGVAVNDFRYLSGQEVLRLDWSDPWYSAFDRKTLRRRYFAPAAAFIYVEDFEIRKEIIFRPKDLQQWINLGIDDASIIRADQRAAIREKVAAFLARHTSLTIDGQTVQGTLDRIHFIERSLKTTGVVELNQDIDLDMAMIGAIYIYPIQTLPTEVTMNWDLFSDRIDQVPTVATDQAGGMPGYLTPEDSVLTWRNYLKNPTRPAFIEISPPTRARTLSISLITIVCLVFIVWIWLPNAVSRQSAARSKAKPIFVSLILCVVAAVAHRWPELHLQIPLEKQLAITDAKAADVAHALLHNIYRAFDYRDESTIYDILERSASGDLLTSIYLETRESLTLASQGGARVKVKQVDLISCAARSAESGSFIAACDWTVTGSVGHWGHIHQRTNQYRGEFKVEELDGQWKFTEMDMLSEERL